MGKMQSKINEVQNLVGLIGNSIIYLIIGLTPHIYKYIVFSPTESESVFYKREVYADLYMLAKSRALLLLTVALLLVFIYQLKKQWFKLIKDKVMGATVVMAVAIIVSSLVSTYSDVVYRGAKDRFEGMWIWLCYLVIFTIARHYAKDRKFIKNSLKVFVLSAGIMAAFGLLQVFGYDIYTDGPLRWLAFPKEIAANMATYMTSNSTEAGAVGALFSSNYFGAYIGVSAIISLYFAFLEDKKGILYLALFILQYGALIASKSEAALLGFAVALFIFVIAYGREIIQKKHYAASVFVLAIVVDRLLETQLLYGQSGNAFWIYILMISGLIVGGLVFVILNKNEMLRMRICKFSSVLSILGIMIIAIGIHIAIGVTGDAGNAHDINSISFNKNILIIEHTNGQNFAVESLEKGINAYDKTMTKLIPEVLNENVLVYTVENKRYVIEVRNYNNGVLLMFKAPMSLNIFYDGTTLQYVNPLSGVGIIESPKRIKYYFEHGSAFTNRGYIWSTYLPEAQKYFLLGKGLDTYLMGYPQNDYFGKTNFYAEGDDLLIDKPHSMYLGVFWGMGITGLVLLIGFAVILLSKYLTGLSLTRDRHIYMISLISAIMILVTGIFNDSVIPMTILLSCFGGMGLGINEETN